MRSVNGYQMGPHIESYLESLEKIGMKMRSISELTGRVVVPGSMAYDEARMNYNTCFSFYPLAVVFCQQTEDVANATGNIIRANEKNSVICYGTLIEAVLRFAGLKPWQRGQQARHPRGEKFKNTGAFIDKSLPLEAIKILYDFLIKVSGKSNVIEFQSYGGALNQVRPEATAFFSSCGAFQYTVYELLAG